MNARIGHLLLGSDALRIAGNEFPPSPQQRSSDRSQIGTAIRALGSQPSWPPKLIQKMSTKCRAAGSTMVFLARCGKIRHRRTPGGDVRLVELCGQTRDPSATCKLGLHRKRVGCPTSMPARSATSHFFNLQTGRSVLRKPSVEVARRSCWRMK